MAHLFFSPEDGRLRAGWRILFFFILNFSLTLLLLLPTLSLFRFDVSELSARNLLISGVVSAISLGISRYAAKSCYRQDYSRERQVLPMFPDVHTSTKSGT